MIYLTTGLRKFEIQPLFIIGGHILKIIRYLNADSRQRKETVGTQTDANEGRQIKGLNLTCEKWLRMYGFQQNEIIGISNWS